MTTNALLFLSASFVSMLGDILLVICLPFGLGLETGRIEFAVIAWLFPAIAVIGASFLTGHITNRPSTARTDYSRLLCGIAILEVFFAVIAIHLHDRTQTLVISSCFVLLYAFTKEGIPRLLYQFSVYQYFVDASHYSRIAGYKSGLDIVAALAGTLVGSEIVRLGAWRYALLIDAATFFMLAAAIRYAGRDTVPTASTAPLTTVASGQMTGELAEMNQTKSLRAILTAVPLFHGVNAVFGNYLPLLNERLGLMTVSMSLTLLAFLRLPGLLLGLNFAAVQRRIGARIFIAGLPCIFVIAVLSYVAFPNVGSAYALMIMNGLNMGVYAPADATVRIRLQHAELIRFNATVLRWLGAFQLVGCLGAIAIYSDRRFHAGLIDCAVLGFVLASTQLWRLHTGSLPSLRATRPACGPRGKPAAG